MDLETTRTRKSNSFSRMMKFFSCYIFHDDFDSVTIELFVSGMIFCRRASSWCFRQTTRRVRLGARVEKR